MSGTEVQMMTDPRFKAGDTVRFVGKNALWEDVFHPVFKITFVASEYKAYYFKNYCGSSAGVRSILYVDENYELIPKKGPGLISRLFSKLKGGGV